MRLFFAIALSDDVRAAVARVEDGLQQRLAGSGSNRAVKWVERENLHITLRFLGEVDEARARALLDALAAPLAGKPFSLVAGGAGAFPPAGAPRVVWVGVRDGADAARHVFDALEQRLAPLAFESDGRAYTPHLTLGRVRDIDPRRGRDLRGWLNDVPEAIGTETVAAVTLYQSRLSPKGPRYEVVKEIPLS